MELDIKPVEIESVSFEHHYRDNIGIGEGAPRISWRYSGTAQNWIQSAYEIEITRPELDFVKSQIFRAESSDSVLVPWPTSPLKSREVAWVRVRSTGGRENGTTPWSSPYCVEAGLLKDAEWSAKMIAAEKILSVNDSLRPTLFRKSFKLNKAVLSARLYITAYGVYEASINGKRVGDHVMAPGWTSYRHHLNYQTFDVTSLLREGKNVIGAELGEGWYAGKLGWGGRCIYGDHLALLAQLEVESKDGTRRTIASDETWKTSTGPRVSSEIYDGEIYDARQEIDGWFSPDFQDERWSSVSQIAFPTGKLRSPEGPPVRKIETVKAQKIFKSPSGKVIIDFGQNLVGGLRVRVCGPHGHTIVFKHVEVLEHGEIATATLRGAKATDSLILGRKSIVWEPKFTFHGFRYAQVENWPSNSGEPTLQEIEAVVIYTDMERTGWFECSEPMVNQLHSNIRWGMVGNFISVPTDCPQRDERLGWTGDIQVFSPTANFLYNTTGMLSGWLRDLAVEQIKDFNGIAPEVVPSISFGSATPRAAWSDVCIILPWDLYKASGDKNILTTQYESMKQWLQKGVARQANGLWNPENFQYGDWLDPDAPADRGDKGKTDSQLVANAYLAHITSLIVEVAKVLGLKDDVQGWSSEAAKMKKLFRDEHMSPNGRLAPSDSMTAIALAYSFNLFSMDTQKAYSAQRLARLVHENQFRIATGFVGTPLILSTLTDMGELELAYRMLLEKQCPSWLYTVSMGGTTIWEKYDAMRPDGTLTYDGITSFNHYGFGSIGSWLHSTVGGISSSSGWKHTLIAPNPDPSGTITSSRTSHLSPYGLVSCSWNFVDGIFKMEAQVPPNTTAEVMLPFGAVGGLGGERNENWRKSLKVGSGVHRFEGVLRAPPVPVV